MLNSVEKNHNVNVYTFLAVTRATEQSEIKRGFPRDSARLHCHTIDICTKQRDVIIVIIPVGYVVPDSHRVESRDSIELTVSTAQVYVES